jgi:hypothetical protein
VDNLRGTSDLKPEAREGSLIDPVSVHHDVKMGMPAFGLAVPRDFGDGVAGAGGGFPKLALPQASKAGEEVGELDTEAPAGVLEREGEEESVLGIRERGGVLKRFADAFRTARLAARTNPEIAAVGKHAVGAGGRGELDPSVGSTGREPSRIGEMLHTGTEGS